MIFFSFFVQKWILIKTEGPRTLISLSILTLLGGQIAFWVRLNEENGILKVTVSYQRFNEKKTVEFEMR